MEFNIVFPTGPIKKHIGVTLEHKKLHFTYHKEMNLTKVKH